MDNSYAYLHQHIDSVVCRGHEIVLTPLIKLFVDVVSQGLYGASSKYSNSNFHKLEHKKVQALKSTIQHA